VTANTIDCFKTTLDKFWNSQDVKFDYKQNLVNVSNKSGGGNHHFRDLETTANDVRKAEQFLTGNTIPSHY